MYDLVYYYRNTESDELRYSMRSACENLNVRRIYLVGDKPEWFKETNRSFFIKSNIYQNLNDLSEVPFRHLKNFLRNSNIKSFILMNDDFFILEKIDNWVDYKRDKIDYNLKVKHNLLFYRRNERTHILLRNKGYRHSDYYNLHIPIFIERDKLEKVLKLWDNEIYKFYEFRTLYGNMFNISECRMNDCKIKSLSESCEGMKFVSTSNESFKFGIIGKEIKERFSVPCFCEK